MSHFKSATMFFKLFAIALTGITGVAVAAPTEAHYGNAPNPIRPLQAPEGIFTLNRNHHPSCYYPTLVAQPNIQVCPTVEAPATFRVLPTHAAHTFQKAAAPQPTGQGLNEENFANEIQNLGNNRERKGGAGLLDTDDALQQALHLSRSEPKQPLNELSELSKIADLAYLIDDLEDLKSDSANLQNNQIYTSSTSSSATIHEADTLYANGTEISAVEGVVVEDGPTRTTTRIISGTYTSEPQAKPPTKQEDKIEVAEEDEVKHKPELGKRQELDGFIGEMNEKGLKADDQLHNTQESDEGYFVAYEDDGPEPVIRVVTSFYITLPPRTVHAGPQHTPGPHDYSLGPYDYEPNLEDIYLQGPHQPYVQGPHPHDSYPAGPVREQLNPYPNNPNHAQDKFLWASTTPHWAQGIASFIDGTKTSTTAIETGTVEDEYALTATATPFPSEEQESTVTITATSNADESTPTRAPNEFVMRKTYTRTYTRGYDELPFITSPAAFPRETTDSSDDYPEFSILPISEDNSYSMSFEEPTSTTESVYTTDAPVNKDSQASHTAYALDYTITVTAPAEAPQATSDDLSDDDSDDDSTTQPSDTTPTQTANSDSNAFADLFRTYANLPNSSLNYTETDNATTANIVPADIPKLLPLFDSEFEDAETSYSSNVLSVTQSTTQCAVHPTIPNLSVCACLVKGFQQDDVALISSSCLETLQSLAYEQMEYYEVYQMTDLEPTETATPSNSTPDDSGPAESTPDESTPEDPSPAGPQISEPPHANVTRSRFLPYTVPEAGDARNAPSPVLAKRGYVSPQDATAAFTSAFGEQIGLPTAGQVKLGDSYCPVTQIEGEMYIVDSCYGGHEVEELLVQQARQDMERKKQTQNGERGRVAQLVDAMDEEQLIGFLDRVNDDNVVIGAEGLISDAT